MNSKLLTVLRIADSAIGVRLRCAGFIVLAIVLLTGSLMAMRQPPAAPQVSLDPVQTERRIAVVETKVIQMSEDIRSIKAAQEFEWAKLLLLSGLGGEAFFRVLRSRKVSG